MARTATAGTPATRARLSPAAIEVDRALARMDASVDWLSRLTPVNADEIAEEFEASGYREMPDSEYGEGLTNDAPVLRSELFALPIKDVENAQIEALLLEKQREIDRQIELVRMRDLDGFIMASISLFGAVKPQLLSTAHEVLDKVPDLPPDPLDVDARGFHRAACREVQALRDKAPDFACEVILDETLGTSLYTQMGDLHIARDYRVSARQVEPLIQHEIGTHAVTRHNGARQPLATLAAGLADYDDLQEGLAVLAEYLAGYLPPIRLRTLAARVVAADMAVKEEKGAAIYAALREEHDIPHPIAFNTALRAKRGGGLTKDALYLKGLAELLAYCHEGDELEKLFLGKFAIKHVPIITRLLEDGILQPPDLFPTYLRDPAAQERLARVRELPLTSLYQETPEA